MQQTALGMGEVDTQLQSAATLVHWQQAFQISLENVCCVRSCGYSPSDAAFFCTAASRRASVGNNYCRIQIQREMNKWI